MEKEIKVLNVVEIPISGDKETRKTDMERITTLMINDQGMELKYIREEKGNTILGFTKSNLTKDVRSISVVEITTSGNRLARLAEVAHLMQTAYCYSGKLKYNYEYNCEEGTKSVTGFSTDKPDILAVVLQD